ncbi:PilZ domain-containing protein [Elongatibacter sediminis]|uniref:PilZ domain-containing protein n=1 Tax=Elongatibacter sediminis TaxID=3119006 RepID=A0AAW9RF06_9GAMM
MAQQGILSLSITDKTALYRSYMPFVQGGGLFVPSTKKFQLGDEVFLLLTVMEFEERLPIPGKVIWITPQGAAGNRKAGIGVQFADTPDGAHARTVIESHLAAMIKSNASTHTM